jgi:hypothetical protein
MTERAVLREEVIARAVRILRRHGTAAAGKELAQRLNQTNAAELAEALERVEAQILPTSGKFVAPCNDVGPSPPNVQALADLPPAAGREHGVPLGPAGSPCPRCSKSSRDAEVARSCPWCGHAWADEGARQPKPGGAA